MQSLPKRKSASVVKADIALFGSNGKIRPEVESAMTKRHTPPPTGYRYVFRPWRTCPQTGERLYAKAFGLRAWPILVPE